MNKHFIVIGGGGYVGIELVGRLLAIDSAKITVISRNPVKKLLFRDDRVRVVNSLDEVQEKGFIINLAFSNESSYSSIKKDTQVLISSILRYEKKVSSCFLLHLSTIVLSEKNIRFGQVVKNNPYIYSKSLQENLLLKIIPSSKISIIRSGNILSANSPWVQKIASKLVNQDPLLIKNKTSSSNGTWLKFLVEQIVDSCMSKKSGNYNCDELYELSWNAFIQELAKKIKIREIKNFSQVVYKPPKLGQLTKEWLVSFGMLLNSSPLYGNLLNRIISSKMIPISKEKIRRNIKFSDSSKVISPTEYKDFELFCDSKTVESDLRISYNQTEFWDELEKGLVEMGYSFS